MAACRFSVRSMLEVGHRLFCFIRLSSRRSEDVEPCQEIEKLQAKGETAEAELKALEFDVTGKVHSFADTFQAWHTYSFPCRSYSRRGEVRDLKLSASSGRSSTRSSQTRKCPRQCY
jgi:hypothetical protein